MHAFTLGARLGAGAVIAGFTALVAGCASTDGEPPERALASAERESPTICLISETSASPTFDIAVRRAFADRGYQVRLVEAKDARAKTCRFVFSLSSGEARNPSELPDFISLEYRDAYTGESHRVRWTKSPTAGGGFVRTHAAAALEARRAREAEALRTLANGRSGTEGNALLTGFYDDPDRIVRGLVDRALPPFDAKLSRREH